MKKDNNFWLAEMGKYVNQLHHVLHSSQECRQLIPPMRVEACPFDEGVLFKLSFAQAVDISLGLPKGDRNMDVLDAASYLGLDLQRVLSDTEWNALIFSRNIGIRYFKQSRFLLGSRFILSDGAFYIVKVKTTEQWHKEAHHDASVILLTIKSELDQPTLEVVNWY